MKSIKTESMIALLAIIVLTFLSFFGIKEDIIINVLVMNATVFIGSSILFLFLLFRDMDKLLTRVNKVGGKKGTRLVRD